VTTKHFLNHLEHERIQRAIQRAEAGTSGDIVVFITHKKAPDPVAAAQEVFTRRHLNKAANDNSLLIFLSPPSRTFAVVGGKALHDAVGQDWWEELAGMLRTHFRTRYYSEGLAQAIDCAGEAFRAHFPADKVDRTGQSDIVEE
jgi:uncharacterized membrane protein